MLLMHGFVVLAILILGHIEKIMLNIQYKAYLTLLNLNQIKKINKKINIKACRHKKM